MSNWYQNIFPNIFGRRINHVERNVAGEWWMTASEDLFSDRKKTLWYSLNNPVLCAVISTRSKLFSQMKITHLDKNGDEIEDSEVLKSLSNPNYYQSQQDWLFSLMWLMSIYGTGYIYYNMDIMKQYPTFLYNLKNGEIQFNDILKVNKFLRTKQDILEFEKRRLKYNIDGKEISIEMKDIIPMYDLSNGVKADFKGINRLESLLEVLDNIHENIRSKHINLKFSKKYIGVNKNNESGAPQITEDDRNNIKRALGSSNVQITNGNIEFKHLVGDFKRLFLDDMFRQDALTIINAYEMNVDVINYALNNSTFANQELGIIRVIQNSIQTSADNLMNSLTSSFGLVEKGESLQASYNHLPVMQGMIKTKLETFEKAVDSYSKSVASGLMTQEEATEMLNNLKIQLGL